MLFILTFYDPYLVHFDSAGERLAILGDLNHRHCPISPLPAELPTGRHLLPPYHPRLVSATQLGRPKMGEWLGIP